MSILTNKNMHRAYVDCRRRKSNTSVHHEFFVDYPIRLYDLLQELRERTYNIGKYRCFILTEPVIREVFAGCFRDRIVHHLLINEIEDSFDRFFIHDSFACRKRKGNLAAVRRLRGGIQSHRAKKGEYPYYLKMDIKSFFMTIDRDILFRLYEKHIYKIHSRYKKSDVWLEEVLYLGRVIIYSDPTQNYVRKGRKDLVSKVCPGKSLFHTAPGKGLPIGNLTSQFFANVYLNELDQYVKRVLKVKHYFRYVDDFVLLGEKEDLLKFHDGIKSFLRSHLELEISDKKTKLRNTESGVDFVGYIVREKYVLPRRRCVEKFKQKLLEVYFLSPDELKSYNGCYRSYKGYLKHAKHHFLLSEAHDIINDASLRVRLR